MVVKVKLVFILLFVLLFLSFMTSGVFAGPAVPDVDNITITDPIDLSTCSSVVIWCNVSISDGDTWTDIDNVNATLWDEIAANEDSSDDNSDHYTNMSCGLNNGAGNNVHANCSFTVQYYANPAIWTCKIYANDTDSNSSSDQINFTINTLRALDANSTIDFTTLDPGATSTDDINNTVVNCGNVPIDLNLSGTNLTNDSAIITNISVSYIKYNVTNYSQDYATLMISLTNTSTYTDFSLAKRTNGVSLDKTYWKISIPSVIEDLIYTGTVTFTAVADT